MRKYLIPFSIAIFCIARGVAAQEQLRNPYDEDIKVNFIRTWDATAPEADPNNLVTRPLRDVKQATQYFDGLGRPLQTLIKKGSLVSATGANVDMVNTVLYDEFGREQFKYLPSPSTATDATKDNGLFKLNPFQQQQAFFNGYLSDQAGEVSNGANWAYSQTKFEASPLNRVDESLAPGKSWVGNNKSIKAKYFVNTDADAVRIWSVSTVSTYGDFGNYSSSSGQVYAAGQLYKNITIDEKNMQVVEFKDKEGKAILKKVQLDPNVTDDGTGRNHTGWLCTYYIYDDLNKLRCVVQPKGVELISSNWVLTNTTILNEQCFRYEYDHRNRMIMKKVPGTSEPDWMVYDERDRLVMMKNHFLGVYDKWLVTLYDDLNRPVQTGFLLDSYFSINSLDEHVDNAAESSEYPFAISSIPSTSVWEYLTKTGYDNYDDYQNIPALSTLGKDFDNAWSSNYNTPYNVSPLYAQQPVGSLQVKGMVTWTETKMLNVSPAVYLYTVNIYDDKGRLIQLKSKNITGGKDITTTQYSWAGQPLITIQKQEKAGGPAQTTVLVTQMTYDDLGRVTKTEKKLSNTLVNSNAMSAYSTVSTMEYDALGQLTTKTVGSKKDPSTGNYYTTRQPLQELKYDYNIRGWMLGMNRDYLITEGQTSDGKYFGFELGYDKTENKANSNFLAAQLNGNITGMVWKSDGDDTRRKYDFTYDAVNRLMQAKFQQQNPDDHIWNKEKVDFSVMMGDGDNVTSAYDANGNILRMQQWGLQTTSKVQLDDLRYSYHTNTNRLKSVTDVMHNDQTKLGDFRTTSLHPQYSTKVGLLSSSTQAQFDAITDYYYDGSGNMIRDLNKDIGKSTSNGISYNHMNQARVVSFYTTNGAAKGGIIYIFDAVGNKLKKQVTENNVSVTYNGTNFTSNISTTTTYIGGMVYETKVHANTSLAPLNYTDKLQYIGQEEGRIRVLYNNTASPNTPTGFEYDYMIKDHLGNVRMMLTEELKQDQYPASTFEGTYSTASPEANSMINHEKKYYTIDNSFVVNSSTMPGWSTGKDYPNNNGNPPYNLSYPSGASPTATATSEKVYRLNALTNKTGLGTVLKVMAGDKIDIHSKSYYQSTSSYDNSNSAPLNLGDIIGAFIGSPDNSGFIGKGINSSSMQTINTGLIPAAFFRGEDGSSSSIPKAYVNYILFDEQFKYTGGGFSRAGSSGTVKDHWFADAALQNILVPKNGYLYVYVSNESNDNVFFDNLQVFHTRGPILEETHYYPFGLRQAGISSKALKAGTPENKLLYTGKELQSKEFSDGSGLELYDYGARFYDAQIGRWHKTDNKAELYFATSPYVYALNQPTNAIDPDGNLVIFIQGNHFGETGHEYWTAKNYYTTTGPSGKTPAGYHPINGRGTTTVYGKDRYFDNEVMTQLNDNHTPRYYDGSAGGWHPLNGNPLASSAAGRTALGYDKGKADAATIIANLERDKSGNIIETIKIVTHSMGGAYGKGFVAALKEYIKTLPAEQQQQIKIEQVIDFDPYQGKDITADGETPTFQFIHYGLLANQKEKGKVEQKTTKSSSNAHAISSFFADISQLQEGTYKWNEQTQKWDLQPK